MRRVGRGRRKITLLCAAGAVMAAVVPAAAQSPADPPLKPVVVVDCFSAAQVRPADYLLACGDGNNRLVGLEWDTWGPHSANATGTDLVKDCTPDCATGRFRSYPVKVTLGDPQSWPADPGMRRFTTIRLVYTGEAPALPGEHDVTYKLVY